jgi:hypothetical protein
MIFCVKIALLCVSIIFSAAGGMFAEEKVQTGKDKRASAGTGLILGFLFGILAIFL